jgi:iron complex transport system substrate-binding protein
VNTRSFRTMPLIVIILVLVTILAGCGQTALTSTITPLPTTTTATVTTPPPTTTAPPVITTTIAPTPTIKLIHDLVERSVVIPANVQRVGALVGPGYEKVLVLGGIDKMVCCGVTPMAWAKKFFPTLANVTGVKNPQTPNVEDLLSQNVQVVFFWDIPEMIEKMTQSGLPVVVTQLGSSAGPQTQADFIQLFKNEFNIFAQVLGKDAQKRADDYLAYFDTAVNRVTSVTSQIPAAERPKVYYVRGPKALTTHYGFSNTYWFVNMAGGDMVTKDLTNGIVGDVTVEQVNAWNPDIIVMGRVATTDIIMNDPVWSEINAVKNGKVYVNPQGAFYSDYGSEGALLLLYLAKTFYPDKFADIDMVKETKYFYEHFYGYTLTDDEANRILTHQDPAQ